MWFVSLRFNYELCEEGQKMLVATTLQYWTLQTMCGYNVGIMNKFRLRRYTRLLWSEKLGTVYEIQEVE